MFPQLQLSKAHTGGVRGKKKKGEKVLFYWEINYSRAQQLRNMECMRTTAKWQALTCYSIEHLDTGNILQLKSIQVLFYPMLYV